jgi:hypothetical protein
MDKIKLASSFETSAFLRTSSGFIALSLDGRGKGEGDNQTTLILSAAEQIGSFNKHPRNGN